MNALKTIETKESSKIFKTTLKEESKMKKIALTLLSLVLLMTFSGMASAADDHADSYSNATPITWQQKIPGKIDYPGDQDWFVIQSTGSYFIQIGTLSSDYSYVYGTTTTYKTDTMGTLYDSIRVAYCLKGAPIGCGFKPNKVIAWNDDYSYPTNLNFRIRVVPPAGTYFLKVQGFGTATGSYMLLLHSPIDPWNY